MKIEIKRENNFVVYETSLEDVTLLEILNEIKTTQDNSLTYSSGCRSSVCGSCAVRVNEREVLACSYKIQDGDRVEALNNMPIIRDLVVDMDKTFTFNAKAKAWLNVKQNMPKLNHQDEKINEIQSDCILCSACYSVCPVYSVNSEFLGPFALTRVWKYMSDKRSSDEKEKIETIQNNGIWDCTLCNECTIVCPQTISSKADIEKLRSKSAQHGFIDPSFSMSCGGFDGSPSF